MIEALLPLLRGQAKIAVHDIDTDPQWREKYHLRVPVLEYSGRMLCEGHLDLQAIAAVLDEIADL